MVLQKTKPNASVSNSSRSLFNNTHLIILFAYVIVICKAMVACYRINSFSYMNVSLLFLMGIFLSKLYSILSAKITIKPAVLLLALSVLLLIFIYNLHHLIPLWDTYIVQNFNSINMGIYYESETYFHQFLPFLIVLLPITSAVCYSLSTRGAAELSILLLSFYMFSFWNNGLDKLLAGYVPAYIMLTILYYSISRYDKTIKRFRDSDIKVTVAFGNIFRYTLLISISITLLAVAAAHIFGVNSIVQLKSNYDLSEIRLANSSKNSVFQLANTIYGSNSGKLGGPIHLDTLVALHVKADRPVYLRATVKDNYDGHSWNKSRDDYAVKNMESLAVPTPDFNLAMTGRNTQKPKTEKMTIYHRGLATSTLFSPNNTFSINGKGGKVLYDTSHTFLLMGKSMVNEPYTLKYYFSNTGVEYFDNIKGTGHSISYETDSTEAASMEYYLNNVLTSYKSYLQVPPSITPRTYKLVDEITRDCSTTSEKVEKIIAYLSRNYPYTLEVSQVPDDVDFIDYFLFTEKKGYCTYFATTVTVMCRIAGIPARYVEGFNMDEEKDSAGFYIVRNHRAHAWTEILVSPESNLWCIADSVPQGASTSNIGDSAPYRDKFDDDRYKTGDDRFANMNLTEYNNDIIRNYISLLSTLLYPLFIIPLVLLLLLAVYIVFRLTAFNLATAKLLAAESMIPFYNHLITRLKVMGEDFPEECCELEYVRSLEDRELSKQLEKVVEACYFEYYGGKPSLPAMNKKSCNKLIEKHMRRKLGFFRYWYRRIRYTKLT